MYLTTNTSYKVFMPDNDLNQQQSDFMIEKIKERPVNKKKLLRRTLITASMAVIFGLIACLTFLILEPVFNNWLYPEEEPQIIVFPEEIDEMDPEDMIVDNIEPNPQELLEGLQLTNEQIDAVLSKIDLSIDNYKQLYSSLSDYAATLSKSMVTVVGVTSDTDWFNNTFQSKYQVSGVIVGNNGKELLILADNAPIKQAESLSVVFNNGQQAIAEEKQYDSSTGLCILAINLSDISEGTLKDSTAATFGSSNGKYMVGNPVIALGSPMGNSSSANYGMITVAGNTWSSVDANYKLLMTDIYGSQSASGVLFNLQGQVIGIITTGKNSNDLKNIITCFGISDLKKVIEKMSNGSRMAYMGISGTDVTYEANKDLGVPYGAYVKDVVMNSPAMLAGIQRGDIIVQMADVEIENFTNYTSALLKLNAGDSVKVVVQRQVQNSYKEVTFKITVTEAR